jgi:hypothetical protein
MASSNLVVYDGAMINHRSESGVLGIVAGNFASEKYTDEKGKETRGATAGLWLVVRGRPDTNTFQRVHAGQQIDFLKYKIQVLAVGNDKRGMHITLDIGNAG